MNGYHALPYGLLLGRRRSFNRLPYRLLKRAEERGAALYTVATATNNKGNRKPSTSLALIL